MQNLTYPKKQILLQSGGPSEVKVYNGDDSLKRLLLLTKGLELIGGTSATYTKQVTDNFQKKAIFLEKTSNAPAELSNVEYGFRVVTKYKTLGYIDNSETRDHGKFYGGVLPRVALDNNGAIVGANITAMEDNIINLVSQDKGFVEAKYGAIINARRAYIVTVGAAEEGDMVVNGVTVTVGTGDAGIAEFATLVNASSTGTKAYQLNATQALIVSATNGGLFDITATVGTVSKEGILVDSRIEDMLYDIEVDNYDWTQTPLSLVDVTFTGAAFNGAVNGGTLITATTQANIITGILATTGVYAVANGASAILVGSDTVESVSVEFPYLNASKVGILAGGAVTYEASFAGKYSSLTSDDVQRYFAGADHAGALRSQIRGGFNTVAGAEYVRFFITSSVAQGALEGASHMSTHKITVEVFVPKDALRSVVFSDFSGKTLDGALDGYKS